jgi:dipeptidyl aminopeptidase/acylaminoacyl peptidase
VVHGRQDPRVPVGEAVQITEALKKRGMPVELMIFDDEGHGLSKSKNRHVAYPAITLFLDRWVRDRK